MYARVCVKDSSVLAVSRQMNPDCVKGQEEDCLFHSLENISAWVIGSLTRSENKEPVDPFPEGVALYKAVHDDAKHFPFE